MKSTKILVQGIVQGVGFRPFVYRVATELKLKGYVRNLGNVVEIVLQGENKNIEQFLYDLKNKKPPISKINSIKTKNFENNEGMMNLKFMKVWIIFLELQLYLLI